MLTKNPELVLQLGWTNIASNLLAVPLCVLLAPAMTRFAMMRRSEVVPVALAAALAATTLTHAVPATLIQLVVFSILGLLLKAANLPRAPLLLGFVLGPGLESGLIRSGMIYGWAALARPGVLAILLLAATVISASAWARLQAGRPSREPDARLTLPVIALVGGVCALALWTATRLPTTAGGILYLAGSVGLGAAATSGVRAWRTGSPPSASLTPDYAILGLLLGAVIITGLVSLPLAAGAFVGSALVFGGHTSYRKAAVIALLTAFAVLGVQSLEQRT